MYQRLFINWNLLRTLCYQIWRLKQLIIFQNRNENEGRDQNEKRSRNSNLKKQSKKNSNQSLKQNQIQHKSRKQPQKPQQKTFYYYDIVEVLASLSRSDIPYFVGVSIQTKQWSNFSSQEFRRLERIWIT